MALERIFGDFQNAGVLVSTTGNSNPATGVEAYAQAVTYVDTNGAPSDLMLETTGQDILTALETPATELPKTPLMTTSDLTRVFDSKSTLAEDSLVSATASQTTRVYALTVTSAGAGYIELRDGSAGTVLMRIDFPAAGAYVFDVNSRPWAKTTANTALFWYRSAAVAMTIQAYYVKSA